jgi:glycosyltransferase involved in cell wall biosynthesis
VKIGLATDFYYPWIGGPATFIRNLGYGLAARGHSVSLLCPSPDGPSRDESDGPIGVRRARTVPVPFGYQLRVSSSPLVDAKRWLDHTDPDIVHIHHPFPLSTSAAWLASSQSIPVVATNHTIPACSLWGLRSTPLIYPLITRGFERWIVTLLRHCQAVSTPTETAAELLHAMGYPQQVISISNGVDTGRFRPGTRPAELAARFGLDSRPVVLYTGRLDAEKQMDAWLHAAALLSRQVDAQFLVGGNGSERTRLEALSRHLGLESRLHFFGYLSEAEYPLVYRLADVFCITSEVELQSIATLEAISSGLPAVGVRAGALPELIRHGENGYLAEPGDAIGVARGLYDVLSDNNHRRDMARCSRTISEQHDLTKTMEAYELFLIEASEKTSVGRA